MHPRVVFAVLGLSWMASCSLKDLDHLTAGAGKGGKSAQAGDGGAGDADLGAGGGISSGGASALSGGTPNASGAAGIGVAGSGFAGGGGSNSGGASASGGSGTTGVEIDPTCPAYDGTGGKLITPPSNGFEDNVSGWTTTGTHSSAISQVFQGANPCEGSAYLACAGSQRSAEWDGPAFDIFPYVQAGRRYAVTVAARFDPAAPPTSARLMHLVSARYCLDSAVSTDYQHLQEKVSNSNWVRFSGEVTAGLDGCPALRKLLVYVDTDVPEAALTIHLDDFRVYDLSPIGENGGAAGASGAAGSAGSTIGGATGSAGSGAVAGDGGGS